MTEPVYLDHHATTPVDPRVVDVMLPYFTTNFGNAASISHDFGTVAAEAVEHARKSIAAFVNASPKEIIFTSGATEADNLAIKGVLHAAGKQAHFITTAAEHRAVLDPAKKLQRAGFPVTILAVDEHGRVSPDDVAAAMTDETRLVSIMLANNEVGTLSDVAAIGRICREKDALLHVDAVQAAPHLPIDVEKLNVDLLSLSAHKMYGPKGVGALYVRRSGRRIVIEPLFDGGGHERQLRSGTLPVPLIVGFAEACRLVEESREGNTAHVAQLRDDLWARLNEELTGLHLNGHPTDRLPNNLNVSFEGVDGEALLAKVRGIAVSSGSACTSADPEPSHVLRAMGRNDQLTRASLRFGFGRTNTPEDVDAAVECVVGAVRGLRK